MSLILIFICVVVNIKDKLYILFSSRIILFINGVDVLELEYNSLFWIYK